MGRGRARPGRALPRRAPRCRARLESAITRSSSTSSSASSSPRAASSPSTRRGVPAARTGVCARCSPGSRSCWPPPSREASSPSSSAARRATPRRPRSRSASALRRSWRRISTARSCSRARLSRSTTRRRTRSYLLADLLRAPAVAGVMHGHDDDPPGDRGQPRRVDARGRRHHGRGALLRRPDVRADRRAGPPARRGARASRTAPTGRRSRSAAVGHITPARRAHPQTPENSALATPEDLGGDAAVATRVAFTKDGSRLVALVQGEGDRASISVRDAATLAAIGPPIEPERFAGAFVGSWFESPGFAAHPRRPLARHRIRRRRARLVGPPSPEADAGALRDRPRASRARDEPGRRTRSPSASTSGIQLVDMRTGAVQTAVGALAGAPSWLRFSPDGETVVSTSLDGTVDALGRRAGDAGARLLRGHSHVGSAAGLQPRREDALHGEPRRDGDRLGHRRRRGGWRGASPSRTTAGSDAGGFDGHPGAVQPRRTARSRSGSRGRASRLRDAKDLTPDGPPLRETGGEV